MTIILIIFVLATLILLAWVILKMDELDEWQDNLDKYSVHLDERANRIAVDEQSIVNLLKQLKNETNNQNDHPQENGFK